MKVELKEQRPYFKILHIQTHHKLHILITLTSTLNPLRSRILILEKFNPEKFNNLEELNDLVFWKGEPLWEYLNIDKWRASTQSSSTPDVTLYSEVEDPLSHTFRSLVIHYRGISIMLSISSSFKYIKINVENYKEFKDTYLPYINSNNPADLFYAISDRGTHIEVSNNGS